MAAVCVLPLSRLVSSHLVFHLSHLSFFLLASVSPIHSHLISSHLTSSAFILPYLVSSPSLAFLSFPLLVFSPLVSSWLLLYHLYSFHLIWFLLSSNFFLSPLSSLLIRAARLIVKRSQSRFKHPRNLIPRWQWFYYVLGLLHIASVNGTYFVAVYVNGWELAVLISI